MCPQLAVWWGITYGAGHCFAVKGGGEGCDRGQKQGCVPAIGFQSRAPTPKIFFGSNGGQWGAMGARLLLKET